MLVIATNNGVSVLDPFLKSIEQFGSSGHEVLVVDTGSTQPESISYIQKLQNYQGSFKLRVAQPPYTMGYEPGAYMFAFRNFEADSYLFLHDTMLAKSPAWVSQFEEICKDDNVAVPWVSFTPLMLGCHQGHLDYLLKAFGKDNWPRWGIFGSIFYAKRKSLLLLDEKKLLSPEALPTIKTGAEGMERGWAIAFHRAGIEMKPVHRGFDARKISEDKLPHLRKIFGGRK